MSVLKKANQEFKKKQYESALALYSAAMSSSQAMRGYIDFNINLTQRRITNSGSKKVSCINSLPDTCNSNPKVSVIIPTYNVQDYIERCADSILNQTLQDIEVIFIDDGSEDRTTEILKSYQKKDGRVKLILNSRSSGNSGVPRNQGLAVAKGEYIAFVDSDDYIDEGMLSDLYLKGKESDAELVTSSGFYRENQDGTTEVVKTTHTNYDPISEHSERKELFKSYHYTIVWFRIYKTEFIKKNKICFGEYKTSADAPFAIKALSLCNKLVSVDGIYYHYRFDRPGSTIERRKGQSAFEVFRAYHNLIEFFKSKGLYKDYLPIIIQKAIGDYSYNSKFIQEEYEVEFESLLISFLRKYTPDVVNWSFVSAYWKSEIENKLSRYTVDKKMIFDDYLNSMKRDNPNVSVIVPAHNVGEYIKSSINSLKNQTLKGIECIIINDGSNDDTQLQIENHIVDMDNFKIISLSHASGNPGTPRNVGLACANGKYIGFVDADDRVEDEFFEMLYKKAQEENANIVTSDTFVKVENGKEQVIKINVNSFNSKIDKDREKLFKQGYFSNIWYRVYERDFLNKHGISLPNIYLSEDFCFSFLSHSFADKISVVKGAKYFYNYDRPGSTTEQRKGLVAFKQIEAHDIAMEYINSFNVSKDITGIFLAKKINSYFYTHKNLSHEYKDKFINDVKSLYAPIMNDVNFNFLAEHERNTFKQFVA
ncbi:glycosyltransferase family 2 protein [Vibrio metschnikovii]|uniref:glycosyltransferase family 2 protein n=1 Tax=Vibrio metschnikovii TaxID=28172 RepID=UPI001C2F3577|nr:glycosyltransferase [Vibrio metschnikovii]